MTRDRHDHARRRRVGRGVDSPSARDARRRRGRVDRGLAKDIARLAAEHDRDDLAERLDEVAQRVGRTDTIVCVVGEFKKGKSALINALVGSAICPVDDDLATMAVTVVRYAEQPTASVRRRENGELVVEAIATDDVPRWVSEREATDRSKVVELVEIGLPNPFLERGITLVDTPGVGGLNAGACCRDAGVPAIGRRA